MHSLAQKITTPEGRVIQEFFTGRNFRKRYVHRSSTGYSLSSLSLSTSELAKPMLVLLWGAGGAANTAGNIATTKGGGGGFIGIYASKASLFNINSLMLYADDGSPTSTTPTTALGGTQATISTMGMAALLASVGGGGEGYRGEDGGGGGGGNLGALTIGTDALFQNTVKHASTTYFWYGPPYLYPYCYQASEYNNNNSNYGDSSGGRGGKDGTTFGAGRAGCGGVLWGVDENEEPYEISSRYGGFGGKSFVSLPHVFSAVNAATAGNIMFISEGGQGGPVGIVGNTLGNLPGGAWHPDRPAGAGEGAITAGGTTGSTNGGSGAAVVFYG